MDVTIKPAADLIEQQFDLESEMTLKGIEKFRAKVAGAIEKKIEDRTVYGTALVDGLLPKVMGELRDFIKTREEGKARNKGAAYKHLKKFEDRLDAVAFIALRLVISNLSSKDVKYRALSLRIGRALEDEIHYGQIRKDDRKLYDYLKDEAKKRFAHHVKRKVVNIHLAKRGLPKTVEWPEKDILIVGSLLVEVLIHLGVVQKHETMVQRGNKSEVFVVATKETREWIEKRNESAEVMRPVYEPMIVEPTPWSSPFNGGYLTNRVRPVRFVKTNQKGYLNALDELEMDDVYAAVNAAQSTAWAINPFILTIMDMAWEADFSLGGLPSKFNEEEPPKPFDIDTNEEARKEWRSAAYKVHTRNREIASKRVGFIQMLDTAKRYQLFPKLYMVYQLDFRGRIYAVPHLNPQGTDYMKAVLQFAEGKPLDEDSAVFLAIHVANTGAFDKIDKAPLEERVQWVYDNQDKIIACADNPFDNRWWTEADSPYCFLAACREWAGWVREGEGFISHLPVALDGSCSGIQHFSMALADEVGGAAVNLVPSDKPADIYTLVLDQALEQARQDASTGGENSEVAAAWLRSGLMTRSCFKRPTMTYGYGSSQFGFREQIHADTLKPAHKAYQEGKGAWHFEDNGFKPSLYMSKVTQDAVERTVVKAAQAMAWLKEVASVVTAEGLPVRWTTTDGLPVVQHYRELKAHRVDTMIFGSRVTTTLMREVKGEDGKPLVSRRKQASGLSPNFVHSLDATHLRMAVLQAYNEGIKSVALIHDSFGTHAADTARFFVILREALVRMYTETDVIEDFTEQMKAQLPPASRHKVPPAPERGTLDLTAVLESDFAFA